MTTEDRTAADATALAEAELDAGASQRTTGAERPIRVVVAFAVRMFRDGLATVLDRTPGIAVVGTACDPWETVRQALAVRPDVLLLEMLGGESLSLARLLGREAPEVRVVAVALPDTEHDIITCAEAGMHGFVTRDQSLAEAMVVIRSVARGETFCRPQTAAALLRRVASLASGRSEGRPLARLTAREMEILMLIETGLSNKQIAHSLSIEVATVKNHVHNLLDKLGARRRGDAVARLREQRGALAPMGRDQV